MTAGAAALSANDLQAGEPLCLERRGVLIVAYDSAAGSTQTEDWTCPALELPGEDSSMPVLAPGLSGDTKERRRMNCKLF